MTNPLKALSALALLLALPVGAPAQDAAPAVIRPAKVMTVTNESTALHRQYPAVVYPSQEAVISFRVPGRVVSLPVRAADTVKAGDIIAELDTRDFLNAVAGLESRRDQALAQLAALRSGARQEEIFALKAAVAAAQAKVDQAADQADRTRQLTERGVVAQAKLDQDEATLTVALANLRTAQEQLAIGEAGGRAEDITAAEAALRGLDVQIDTARDNLADATLRAPFDGIVARRDIDSFTNIQAGQPVILLQNIDTVELVIDIPGADVLRWSEMDKSDISVSIDISGGPQDLTAGTLVEFSTQADPGTQTYPARFAVRVPEGQRVLPGMVGQVRLKDDRASGTLPEIPLSAIATDPDGSPLVWVVDDDDTLSPRPVTLGEVAGDAVPVTDGLQAGERIVTAGVSQLRDGMVIRPIAKVGN